MSNKEFLRQLKILTNAARRMGREVQMYRKETKGFEDKVASLHRNNGQPWEIKREEELLQESQAVLRDCMGRAQKFQASLQEALDQSASENALDSKEHEMGLAVAEWLEDCLTNDSEEKPPTAMNIKKRKKEKQKQKEQQSSQGSATPETKDSGSSAPSSSSGSSGSSGAAKDRAAAKLRVAVYGGSSPKPGDAVYDLGYQLGLALGDRKYYVLNGGYFGTMESVAKGATEKGSKVEGVVSSGTFQHRKQGNEFLTYTTDCSDLQTRIMHMTSNSDAFVVLPGNLGTMTELMITWNVSLVNKFCNKPPLPIFAFADPWEKVLQAIKPIINLSDDYLSRVVFVKDVDDLMTHLSKVKTNK